MRLPRTLLVFLARSWAAVLSDPDPPILDHSFQNLRHPRADREAVAAIAARLPDDPRLIEAAVLGPLVPYAYDWQTASVPWYFPTTSEVLAAGRGDCESRAVLLASILTAKRIPYSLRLSFDHIWVEYPGKPATALENAGLVVAGTRDGRFFVRWPKDFSLVQEVEDQVAIYWTPAPLYRVVLLIGGLLLVMSWNAAVAWLAGTGTLALVRLPSRSAVAASRRRFAARAHRV
jgi:hypothetical protein